MLQQWRILSDFGLLILIWLVQLIIYPSFQFLQEQHFKRWHYLYTGFITAVVLPLMLIQLATYVGQVYLMGRWHDIANLVAVITVWVLTFTLSVPCHDRLQKDGKDLEVIHRLVATNWYRTTLWTVVFLVDVWVFELVNFQKLI